MGEVMKVEEKKVGDATISTIYHFTEFEDFLYWESGEGGNVEALTLSEEECEEASEDGEEYEVVGNVIGHGFKEGEVVFLTGWEGGVYREARNRKGMKYYVHEEDLVKL